MGAQMVITHVRASEDAPVFTQREVARGALTLAPEGTLCQGSTPYSGSTFGCGADQGRAAEAIHTWEGRHYCATHSPFDQGTVLAASPLCPDVLKGCSHTMVQNDEGVGVACAEWADAHGIEWRQAPAPGVTLAKATDSELTVWERELISRADAGLTRGGQLDTLPGWVWRGLLRNSPCALEATFAWFAPVTLAPEGLPEGEWSL